MSCLAFGEVLWDVIDGEAHLGGAPLNVAIHLAQLGLTDIGVLSSVGRDARGERAYELLESRGVDARFIHRHEDLSTGQVSVEISENGDASYRIHEQVAWDSIPEPASGTPRLKLLYFGSLAQRTDYNRRTLEAVIRHGKPEIVFFDVNIRQRYYSRDIVEQSLRRATILKANDEEVRILSTLLFSRATPVEAFVTLVRSRYAVPQFLITAGSQGVTLYHPDGVERCTPAAAQVVDTIGAGDALSAGFLCGTLRGMAPTAAIEIGMRLADAVVGQRGATPVIDPRLVLPSG